MQATVGDRLHVHGHAVGDPDKLGEIIEVHGKEGEPPYLVRFDDGHIGLVFPGPDAVVEHPRRKGPAGGSEHEPKGGAGGGQSGRAAGHSRGKGRK